jgi:threonine/homoserine/homoserine lactone efflux protein
MFPWASFFIFVLIMTFTPGPNNIMSMNNAKNVGLKEGIIFNFGMFAGIFGVMVLCLLFSSILYALIPSVLFPMKILGAGYMGYLIFKTIVPSKKHDVKDVKGSFVIGALLQLANPKLIIFGITVMSSYVLVYYSNILVLGLFALFLAIIGFIATFCWAIFGSLAKILFTNHGKLLNAIMVILLLYCIVSLFIS